MSTVPTYSYDDHINDSKKYPYSLAWLFCVMRQHVENPTVIQVFNIMYECQDWLSENVRKDGINNYQWSHDEPAVAFYRENGETVKFSSVLRFKYEEDLLAFSLRFNMFSTL